MTRCPACHGRIEEGDEIWRWIPGVYVHKRCKEKWRQKLKRVRNDA